MMATMKNLAEAILAELRCRPDALPIPELVADYGRGVLAVLWQLRRERRVRLVALGESEERWQRMTGYRAADCIRGENELFVKAERR